MMTMTDAYVVVTRLAILFTPIVLVVWWFEHRDGIRRAWSDYRQRGRDHRDAVRLRNRETVHTSPRRQSDPSPRRRP